MSMYCITNICYKDYYQINFIKYKTKWIAYFDPFLEAFNNLDFIESAFYAYSPINSKMKIKKKEYAVPQT